MTDEQLARANKVKSEIKRIEDFLFYADRVWTGKIIKETSRYIFKSNGYGALSSAEYELDTETKNELLVVLRNKLTRLKDDLSSI